MNAATMDTYRANGVQQLTWYAEGDACEQCEENAAAAPISIDDDWPNGDVPVHPGCRCSVAADIGSLLGS